MTESPDDNLSPQDRARLEPLLNLIARLLARRWLHDLRDEDVALAPPEIRESGSHGDCQM